MKLIRFALYQSAGNSVWYRGVAFAALDALASVAVDLGAGALFGHCLVRTRASGGCI
jgi:hypothetical protein